jgi:hypothetical protein
VADAVEGARDEIKHAVDVIENRVRNILVRCLVPYHRHASALVVLIAGLLDDPAKVEPELQRRAR